MTAAANNTVTFKGNPLTLMGNHLKSGDKLPAFTVTGQDMGDITSSSFSGKVLVVSTVPSLDTPVCSIETKRFSAEAAKLSSDVTILTVSYDLPFAQKRWCGAEGVSNVVTGSEYKHRAVGESFGVLLKEWGLLGRAVFVADRNGTIVHAQYVPEITQEPDYDAVVKAVTGALR